MAYFQLQKIKKVSLFGHLIFFSLLLPIPPPLPVDQTQIPHLSSVLTAYESVKEKGTLLCVEFVTLCDYLHYLKVAAQAIQPLGRSAMIFLAAAVADFYVPGYALVSIAMWMSIGLKCVGGKMAVFFVLSPQKKKPSNSEIISNHNAFLEIYNFIL